MGVHTSDGALAPGPFAGWWDASGSPLTCRAPTRSPQKVVLRWLVWGFGQIAARGETAPVAVREVTGERAAPTTPALAGPPMPWSLLDGAVS